MEYLMRIYLLLIFLLISNNLMFSQDNVGIGTNTPDESSILDLESTEKGFLVPRMTTAQRNAIANPANSLIIYDTDEESYYYNAGTPASPNWAPILSNQVDLTADVTGILPIANGGLGQGAITGIISGDGLGYSGLTGTSEQVTFWSGANTISGSNNLTFDGSILSLTGDFDATNITVGSLTAEDITSDYILFEPTATADAPTGEEGMLYYDSDDEEFKVYNATASDWVSVGGSGGGGTPGGNPGNIQYNNSGAFAGSDNLFWDSGNSRLGIGTSSPGFSLEVSGTANANVLQAGKDGQDGQLIIYSEQGVTDYSVTFSPNATMTDNTNYILPADDGDADQVLVTDGTGSLSWEDQNSDWSLTGNAGTTAGSNFIGTTDNVDFVIKTNNAQRINVNNDGFIDIYRTTFMRNGSGLAFYDGDGSHYSLFSAAPQSVNILYTFPSAQGSADQVLTNDGSGNLSWEDPPGLPSGSDSQTLRYDDANSEWEATNNIKVYDDAVQMNKAVALEPVELSISSSYTITTNDLKSSSYFIVNNSNSGGVYLDVGDGSYLGQLLIIEVIGVQEINSCYMLESRSNIKTESTGVWLGYFETIMFVWDGNYWVSIANNENR
jgi:hypothetical protein